MKHLSAPTQGDRAMLAFLCAFGALLVGFWAFRVLPPVKTECLHAGAEQPPSSVRIIWSYRR